LVVNTRPLDDIINNNNSNRVSSSWSSITSSDDNGSFVITPARSGQLELFGRGYQFRMMYNDQPVALSSIFATAYVLYHHIISYPHDDHRIICIAHM
jgi:hypothetical protein